MCLPVYTALNFLLLSEFDRNAFQVETRPDRHLEIGQHFFEMRFVFRAVDCTYASNCHANVEPMFQNVTKNKVQV